MSFSHANYCNHWWNYLNQKGPNFTLIPTFYFFLLNILAFEPINKPALLMPELDSRGHLTHQGYFAIWHKS